MLLQTNFCFVIQEFWHVLLIVKPDVIFYMVFTLHNHGKGVKLHANILI